MSLLALLLTMSTTTSQTGIAQSADGVAIHYATHGQGEIALVFVHGWAINRRYWDEQVPAFARTHRVVTLDLAGHGRSGRERKDWSMAAFGQDVRAALRWPGCPQSRRSSRQALRSRAGSTRGARRRHQLVNVRRNSASDSARSNSAAKPCVSPTAKSPG